MTNMISLLSPLQLVFVLVLLLMMGLAEECYCNSLEVIKGGEFGVRWHKKTEHEIQCHIDSHNVLIAHSISSGIN